MLEDFGLGTFDGRLGETFRVHLGEEKVLDLRLASANALGDNPGRPFSLVFKGPGNMVLPQRTYRLGHAEIGGLDLFLVPIGPEGEEMRYEAIFN